MWQPSEIYSGKNHQWMLKGVGQSLLWNRTFTVSKYFPTKYLLITRGEKKSKFRVEKPGNHHLHQVIKINFTSKDQIDITCLLISYTKNMVCLPKIHMRKCQPNPN